MIDSSNQALRYRLKDGMNVRYITVLNQRAHLTTPDGTPLSFSYAAGQNAMELQHAVEVAEKFRHSGAVRGNNFSTPNKMVLEAVQKFCPNTTVEPMQ